MTLRGCGFLNFLYSFGFFSTCRADAVTGFLANFDEVELIAARIFRRRRGQNIFGDSPQFSRPARSLFKDTEASPGNYDRTAASTSSWSSKRKRRWQASYHDANGKHRSLGSFDTQEAAAHAVNAAIRRAGLEGKRHTNPVVDGRLVPRALKAHGHGPKASRKRRRDKPAATPSTRARRPRRAVNYAKD